VESGKWKVESRKSKVESGKSKVESGKWKEERGKRKEERGKTTSSFKIFSNNRLGHFLNTIFLPSPLSAGSSFVAKPAGYRLGQGYGMECIDII
jgi:hypothetical protein